MKTQFHENKNILLERFSPHCVFCKFRNLMCVSNFPSVRQKQTSLCKLRYSCLESFTMPHFADLFCDHFSFSPIPFPTKQIKKKLLSTPGKFTVRIQLNHFGKYRVHNSAMSQNNSLNIGSGSLKKYISFNKRLTLSVYRSN